MRFPLCMALCLATALLAGCGRPLDGDSYAAVETGMNRQQVVELLGEPDRTRSADVGGVSGTHLAWEGEGFVVMVQFVNDRVVAKQWIDAGQ